jgi:hypothetical protein
MGNSDVGSIAFYGVIAILCVGVLTPFIGNAMQARNNKKGGTRRKQFSKNTTRRI